VLLSLQQRRLLLLPRPHWRLLHWQLLLLPVRVPPSHSRPLPILLLLPPRFHVQRFQQRWQRRPHFVLLPLPQPRLLLCRNRLFVVENRLKKSLKKSLKKGLKKSLKKSLKKKKQSVRQSVGPSDQPTNPKPTQINDLPCSRAAVAAALDARALSAAAVANSRSAL
jgi:hypothetical protein